MDEVMFENSEELSVDQRMVVGEFLTSQLDTQLGRAEAHFGRYLQEQAYQQPAMPLPWRLGRWSLGIAGAALAASLAALWASQPIAPLELRGPSITAPPGQTVVNAPLTVEKDVQSQTFDDGTILIDGKPVRVIRRRDLERTRWFDQNQKLQREQVVPEDHVTYVHLKTY